MYDTYDLNKDIQYNVNDHGKAMTSFRPTDLGTVYSPKSLNKKPDRALNTKHVATYLM